MTKKQVQAIFRDCVLPQHPDWIIKDWMVFPPPKPHYLTCVHIMGSAYSKHVFTVHMAITPMYSLMDRLMWFSKDLDRQRGAWTLEPREALCERLCQAIEEQAIPWFAELDEPKKFAENGLFEIQSRIPAMFEALAGARALIGDGAGAVPLLEQAIQTMEKWIPEYGEEEDKEYLRRLRHMRKLLDEGTEQSVAQLLAWERLTLKTLGLAEYFPAI